MRRSRPKRVVLGKKNVPVQVSIQHRRDLIKICNSQKNFSHPLLKHNGGRMIRKWQKNNTVTNYSDRFNKLSVFDNV